jgi:hypothetical protein
LHEHQKSGDQRARVPSVAGLSVSNTIPKPGIAGTDFALAADLLQARIKVGKLLRGIKAGECDPGRLRPDQRIDERLDTACCPT